MSVKLESGAVARFNEWFQSRVRSGCPFCGGRNWTVHDELAVTASAEADTHHIHPRHGAAMVQITCDQCAFTAAFSATRIGLLQADADGAWEG